MPHDLPPTKATVLISGEGSNLQALIDAAPLMPHLKIVRVISNKAGANGLNRAKAVSIPTAYHNLVSGKYYAAGEKDPAVKAAAREKYDADLAAKVLADDPDIVICAGWMHILTSKFLDPLAEKRVPVINLHPALPKQYDGANAIERAYDDYHKGTLEDDTTGIMVHYVISEVDRGEPIVIRKIQCQVPETLDELKTRMHSHEHELIVEGTQLAISDLWQKMSNPE
ncbi:Phosphoribosylglycinamide formyltransferase [Lachnellula occidentalis]|uniref:Phosphoribosylglycinamide formyltransferase n=1 Tax=Lachnellula occidentalis TaxID=215460 RepID=A0A8H8UG62_9HELO|nr:Phosphoribosylglycinamide formyltransferase [Lachnellula occidentalis]